MTIARRLTTRNLAALAVLALCVELWMLFSDVHFLWRPQDVSLPRRVVAHVDSVQRRVMVRTPLQLSWSAASSGQALYEGDEIATLDEGAAAITFIDSEKLQLGPNSLMRLRHLQSVDEPVFRLALLRGSVFQDRPRADAAAHEGRFEIEVAGRKVVAGGQNGFNIAQGDFASGGEAGHINLGGGPPPVGTPVAPSLEEPYDGAVLVNSAQIHLSWKTPNWTGPVAVEVSRDPAFKLLISRREGQGLSSWAFRPGRKGHYFWRVVAQGRAGAAASEVRSFEVVRDLDTPKLQRPKIETDESAPQQKLAPPRLHKPSIQYQPGASLWLRALEVALSFLETDARAAESTADSSGASGSSGSSGASGAEESHGRYNVKLSWLPVTGAHAYTLQISPEARFNHLVAEKILTEPAYVWRSNVAGLYYWRVAAVDAEGDRGPFSEFMTFDIKAERNRQGDETSYETYLRFDEYSGHSHRFRILAGPEFSSYNFVPNGTVVSPSTTRYTVITARQAEAEYAYRLDNYYSFEIQLKSCLSHVIASRIQPSGQHTLNQNNTTMWLAVERRIFEPRHYYTLEGGVRLTLVDIPVGSGSLSLSTFNFVGGQFLAGVHKPVGRDVELAFKAGPILMYGNQSLLYGGLASEAISKALTDVFTAGLRFEQQASFYHFEAENLGGDGRAMKYDGFIYLEFNF